MFCSKCGKDNDGDANFCKVCGQVLKVTLETGADSPALLEIESEPISARQKKTGWIAGIAVFILLVAVGSYLNLKNNVESSISDIATGSDSSAAAPADYSWVPSGFNVYEGDSDVAWAWTNKSCGAASFEGCYHIKIVTNKVCSSNLYVELNELDGSKNVLGMTNASLGHLDPGRTAVLEFPALRQGAKSAELAKIMCF